jgi:hypothetical protein
VSKSYTQSVCLLGWGISPSQGFYLHTGRHNNNKKHTQTFIPLVEFELMTSVFEGMVESRALGRSSTVIDVKVHLSLISPLLYSTYLLIILHKRGSHNTSTHHRTGLGTVTGRCDRASQQAQYGVHHAQTHNTSIGTFCDTSYIQPRFLVPQIRGLNQNIPPLTRVGTNSFSAVRTPLISALVRQMEPQSTLINTRSLKRKINPSLSLTSSARYTVF